MTPPDIPTMVWLSSDHSVFALVSALGEPTLITDTGTAGSWWLLAKVARSITGCVRLPSAMMPTVMLLAVGVLPTE
ncbi:hypothetical protein [Burkholderia ambifaria]|uniref:hypothetical protein n=1 Tax=Burkholderia ambifaria TaxID=152480 RepID=UPI002011ADA0|nr:hypothetical protein [Burkholderia ambifaria]